MDEGGLERSPRTKLLAMVQVAADGGGGAICTCWTWEHFSRCPVSPTSSRFEAIYLAMVNFHFQFLMIDNSRAFYRVSLHEKVTLCWRRYRTCASGEKLRCVCSFNELATV